MNRIIINIILILFLGTQLLFSQKITLVIHGGAGTILKENMTPELEEAYTAQLEEALRVGYGILESGGTSLDAITETIKILEDSPLFNAGKGAVFTNEGKNELDASIMDGQTMMAGAVASITTIKNPILAARAVMENTDHVMLVGKGAEEFAETQNLEIVTNEYFKTEKRWEQIQKIKSQEDDEGLVPSTNTDEKHGTVGAVALDQYGNLAAGTSTGGMTNKKFGRVGDSPIIGAGTYANNQSCAVSATGHGEFFIRYTVARDIAALMEYQNLSLKDATHQIVKEKLVEVGGSGGIIAVDAQGNYAMPFNTEGMYRGVAQDGDYQVFIYKD